jgi:hypothetical protein
MSFHELRGTLRFASRHLEKCPYLSVPRNVEQELCPWPASFMIFSKARQEWLRHNIQTNLRST